MNLFEATCGMVPDTRYALGRALQVVGMLILPLAIAAELANRVGLGQSLAIAAGGLLVFYIGVQVQGDNRP